MGGTGEHLPRGKADVTRALQTPPPKGLISTDMGSRLVRVNRTLAFALPCRDSQLEWLLREFRLIVNKSIRIAVEGNIRSRTKLARAAYAELSREHAIYKQYI